MSGLFALFVEKGCLILCLPLGTVWKCIEMYLLFMVHSKLIFRVDTCNSVRLREEESLEWKWC